MSVAFSLQRDRQSDRRSVNAARLSSVTAWTVVQLRDLGQIHTSTDDWRYTRAAHQMIAAPAGSFQPYTVAINPTGALEMHQKNEAFKSIEEQLALTALSFARRSLRPWEYREAEFTEDRFCVTHDGHAAMPRAAP